MSRPDAETGRHVVARAAGRATVAILGLNGLRRLRIREAEHLFDLFPPEA